MKKQLGCTPPLVNSEPILTPKEMYVNKDADATNPNTVTKLKHQI